MIYRGGIGFLPMISSRPTRRMPFSSEYSFKYDKKIIMLSDTIKKLSCCVM